jgi:hypothetical protein
MPDNGTNQPQPDPKTELAAVIAQLAEHGITLSISDAGTVLVQGYAGTPDQAAILVANRELINRHLATHQPIPEPIPQPIGLEPGFNPHSARSSEPKRRPLRPSLAPEEIEALRLAHKAARRRELRSALAASRVPLTGPPPDLPDSGPGVVTGPATLPPYQVAAQARAYRDAHRGMGGRRSIPIYSFPDPL